MFLISSEDFPPSLEKIDNECIGFFEHRPVMLTLTSSVESDDISSISSPPPSTSLTTIVVDVFLSSLSKIFAFCSADSRSEYTGTIQIKYSKFYK